MKLTMKRGTQQPVVRCVLYGRLGGKTGLTARLNDLTVAYIRDGAAHPTRISLSPWEEEAYTPGGFREVDDQLMPGLYELALPGEVCAEGANRATLMIQGPDIDPQVIHLDLVGYDPYDQERLGLACLSREGRHEVISRAFREVIPEIVEEFRRQPAPGSS